MQNTELLATLERLKKAYLLMLDDKFTFGGVEYIFIYSTSEFFVIKKAGRGNRKEIKINRY